MFGLTSLPYEVLSNIVSNINFDDVFNLGRTCKKLKFLFTEESPSCQMQKDISELWIQHQRRNNRTTQTWACTHCEDRTTFLHEDGSAKHRFAAESAEKRPKDKSEPRQPSFNEATYKQPEHQTAPSSKPLSDSGSTPTTRTLSRLRALNFGTPRGSEDFPVQDLLDDNQTSAGQPRKRAAIGDGISAGSPRLDSSASPPTRKSKARSTSVPYGSDAASLAPRKSKAIPTSAPYQLDSDTRSQDMFDANRRQNSKGQLWTPGQEPLSRASFDPSNVASLHTPKQRAQGLQSKRGEATPPPANTKPPIRPNLHITNAMPTAVSGSTTVSKAENYEIVLQPETRPISQEQLVAEVKGIYAGLVMGEAKCIEVDNKQATLAQADPGSQPKLNNEQWQALIALHRTLLHEHHLFFLASQHPLASLAFRRLASKYAMPARMWRHGIHSFLELLRHQLPASLDYMLAFIYLAYSMIALLYETVPAFEDTWIECLGDLGRYRMAIEDDDIRDREVWTEVARHWCSKASVKAPTTGRLYHHLAILARPNAVQQLFYYSKSLCVAVPFISARESILTLFDPVLNADNGQSQYRLSPLDTSFVKAHGLLFNNRDLTRFEPAISEFLNLLDNQIGRVTRKFMTYGYHIAIANSVAMLGFASKDNTILKDIHLPVVIHQSCLSADSSSVPPPDFNGTSKPNPVQQASVHVHTPVKWDLSSSPLPSILQPTPGLVFSSALEMLIKHETLPEDSMAGFWGRHSEAGNHTRNHASEGTSESSRDIDASITQPAIASSTSSICLQNFVSRFIRVLDRDKRITALLFFLGQLKIVAAMPTSHGSDCAREITGPLVIFTLVALILSTVFIAIVRADQGPWRDSNLLMFAMIVVSIGTFFLGMDEENVPIWQLGLVWTFGASLNVAYLKEKLIAFPKHGGLTALTVAALGLTSAIFLVDKLEFRGRYADPWIFGTVTSLPTTVFFTLFWVAAILKTGVAQKLEDGAYNGPILDFVNNFLLSFFTRVAAARVFGIMDNEAGRTRHQGWNPNAPERFRPTH